MSQYSRVKTVLELADRPLALHHIGSISFKMHRVRDAETAISARIRDIRRDLEQRGKTIVSSPAKGKRHHLYRIVSIQQ
mgnify:CR=1 FL=1